MKDQPMVSLIMGSASDEATLTPCRRALDSLGLSHEARILSAHRTPRELVTYVEGLVDRGIKVIIAAAGLAAHLPGVVAAHTPLPVIGVPLTAGPLQGLDALFSVAQMPGGVPVACVGVGASGARNAAYLAARMVALFDGAVATQLERVTTVDRQAVLDATVNKEY